MDARSSPAQQIGALLRRIGNAQLELGALVSVECLHRRGERRRQAGAQQRLAVTQLALALTLIVPDYVLPDQFLATDAATLDFAYPLSPPIFGHDQVGYASLPIDGTNALARVGVPTSNVATNFAGANAVVPALPVTVVEYYNPALDHYFISALQPDIDALDTGHIGGWRRTGFSFRAFISLAGSSSRSDS